jgi:hypothetical protein
MPVVETTLGYALVHIYDFDRGGTIYLPDLGRYEPSTSCLVAIPSEYSKEEIELLHRDCLSRGFLNWLNVAVVSDTCDSVETKTEEALVSAFNEDCQVGRWLRKMMNYWN